VTPLRRFWIDYRNAVKQPGMAFGPVSFGLVAGVTLHGGILLDLLVAVMTAAIVIAIAPTTFVLVRRVPASRRRVRDSGADTQR
jgi:hypothetical protein